MTICLVGGQVLIQSRESGPEPIKLKDFTICNPQRLSLKVSYFGAFLVIAYHSVLYLLGRVINRGSPIYTASQLNNLRQTLPVVKRH